MNFLPIAPGGLYGDIKRNVRKARYGEIKVGDSMAGFNKVDDKTHEERVHEVSLLLKRKSVKIIIEYIIKEWGIEQAQAYKYISEAKKEWKKYFSQVKKCGMAYHVNQLRELKDMAFGRGVVVGKGEKKIVITVPDLNLVFDITKEEAKLMGIYPAEKHEETRKVIILGKKEEEKEKKDDEAQ